MITVEQLQEVLSDNTLTEREKTLKIETLNGTAFDHECKTSSSTGINPNEAEAATHKMFDSLRVLPKLKMSIICELMDTHLTKRELSFRLACDLMNDFKESRENPVMQMLSEVLGGKNPEDSITSIGLEEN